MPQVTVYIREDDLDKWKAIGKKAEFISNVLNQADLYKKLSKTDKQSFKEGLTNLGQDLTKIPPTAKHAETKDSLLNIPGIKMASELRPDYGVCKKCGTPLTKFKKCLNMKLHK